MEVLNLATKEKQDEILSRLPIGGGSGSGSGGTDFLNMLSTPVSLRTLTTDPSGHLTTAEILGEGILVGVTIVSITGTITNPIRIKFDNSEEFTINSSINGVSINLFIPFKEKIELSAYKQGSSTAITLLYNCLLK